MNPHDSSSTPPTDEHAASEQAVQFALGLLPPDEHEAFENALLAGDPVLLRAMDEVGPACEMLLRAFQVVEPDLIVRSRLLRRVDPDRAAPSFSEPSTGNDLASKADAMFLLRHDDIQWQDLPVPGCRSKTLYIDRDRKRATLLIKLDPGVAFPDHDHPDVEECLVLDGDIELGGKVMRRFDYMRIPAHGRHGTPRTTSGCLLLVTCGILDAA